MIEVVSIGKWSTPGSRSFVDNIYGQITVCRYKGILFYVRENINGIPSFNISSGERWGDKTSNKPIRKERQTLELLAPAGYWDEIAKEVYKVDPLNRPVIFNKRFTEAWVKKQLSNGT